MPGYFMSGRKIRENNLFFHMREAVVFVSSLCLFQSVYGACQPQKPGGTAAAGCHTEIYQGLRSSA